MLIKSEKTLDVLTVSECKASLDSLSDAEWIKLGKTANYLSWGLAIEGEDLLNLALCKTLEGKRKCPRNVSILIFLRGAMESLVDAYLKRRKRDPLQQLTIPSEEEDALDLTDLQPTMDTPEEMLIAKQTLEEIYEIFKDDENIQMVLMAQLDGYSPKQIQETVGLTAVQYASTLKAIRRKSEKLTK